MSFWLHDSYHPPLDIVRMCFTDDRNLRIIPVVPHEKELSTVKTNAG